MKVVFDESGFLMKVVFDEIFFLMNLTTFILILMNPHLTSRECAGLNQERG